MGGKQRYWLVKSEPSVYSIDDLARDRKTFWHGVRNYQARNTMRDEMKKGDLVLFYHSNADPPGVAGMARVCREAYPDFTAWDRESEYHDPKSSEENPIWFMVDVEFVEKFPTFVSRDDLCADPSLNDALVTRKGRTPSVQPVEPAHFRRIRTLARRKRRQ